MTAVNDGDSQTWTRFFEEHDELIRSVVGWRKWFFPIPVQEDIAQQIRLELTRLLPEAGEIKNERGFVKRICICRCIDQVRRDRKSKERMVSITLSDDDGNSHDLPLPATGPEFDPRREVEKRERAEMLGALLGRLDGLCQTAIREFYLEDLSYREMAERHQIAVNTVGARLSKCLEKLRTLAESGKHWEEDSSSGHD